ncbi:tyrosine-type recombinase/integrase [Aureimonas leprariae]|uniref:Tyrosine-type recombinase/integrase n=1 Tax=Plantimonas leprariae TaxID=2615207 RepID=A0A7V7U077_9HYPH|nr:site-specific integrase [Aureimonas leprariae]KAB0680151.1 tyrosine-type recombinase/integrase [Aureimonas leprariae]
MRFTGPSVARLALPDGKSDHIVFDDGLPGFGIRLRAGGKKVWIAQYRVGSKQRRLTIGSADRLSLDAARNEAKAILAKVQLGADPQTEKLNKRNETAALLGDIADDYVEGPAKRRLRPNSYASLLVHLNKHWKPLRVRPLNGIQRADVAMRLNEIAKESGPFAANRARACLSSLFAWAISEGIAEANPVNGTRKATEEVSRDRVLSDDELALVWRHAGDGDYGRIVRLLILTGQRREEVGGMMRAELHTMKLLWSLPRERTKNGLPHDVPLSMAASDIIAVVPKRADRDFVFGSRDGPFSGWSKSKSALDARIVAELEKSAEAAAAKAKPMPPWRLHDIRRTVATRLGDLGVLPHVVEAVLNHVSGHRAGVAGIYNRATYAAEKRAALDAWSAHLGRVVGP